MATTFETKRLLLRPWRTEDAPVLYTLASDSAVGPACGWMPHTSVQDSRHVIESILAPPDAWALVLKKTALPIGSIGVSACRAQGATESDAELGYWVGRDFWGCGYAPEAIEPLLHYCFHTLRKERVWCGYFDGNEKSSRVQEKCGFVYHHTEHDMLWPIGRIDTEHYTCMDKKAFLERYRS